MAEIADTISDSGIRLATAIDVDVVTKIVANAYCHYIPRMGRTPAPMLDDYSIKISEGCVWVVEEAGSVRGVAVLLPKQDHMLLENIKLHRDPALYARDDGRKSTTLCQDRIRYNEPGH